MGGGSASSAGGSNRNLTMTASQMAIQALSHDTADPNGNANPLTPSGVGPVRNADGSITMQGGASGAKGFGGLHVTQ